ncbi:hypothetical protein [Rhodanobacter umsongensis]
MTGALSLPGGSVLLQPRPVFAYQRKSLAAPLAVQRLDARRVFL